MTDIRLETNNALDWIGRPFPLTATGIADTIEHIMPGAYALGDVDKDDRFRVSYVGRSDDSVGDRLFDHIDDYPYFKFGYYRTSKEAFEKECRLYHDFNPPDNKRHPARPAGTNYKCPAKGFPYNK